MVEPDRNVNLGVRHSVAAGIGIRIVRLRDEGSEITAEIVDQIIAEEMSRGMRAIVKPAHEL